MGSGKVYKITKAFAAGYDQQCREFGWISPEILFGLTYEYIREGDKLLDLGIGTGLSARYFYKAGLQVYGIDDSEEMLKICNKKHIAEELKIYDLNQLPLPYTSSSFDHVTANGLFHLFGDIRSLTSEVGRLIKNDGIFSFTYEEDWDSEEDIYEQTSVDGLAHRTHTDSGIRTYRHQRPYIEELLAINRFSLLKETIFRAFKATDWSEEKYFKACIAKYTG